VKLEPEENSGLNGIRTQLLSCGYTDCDDQSYLHIFLSMQLKYMVFHTFPCILHHLRVCHELSMWPALSWLDSSVGRVGEGGRGTGLYKSTDPYPFFVKSVDPPIVFVQIRNHNHIWKQECKSSKVSRCDALPGQLIELISSIAGGWSRKSWVRWCTDFSVLLRWFTATI